MPVQNFLFYHLPTSTFWDEWAKRRRWRRVANVRIVCLIFTSYWKTVSTQLSSLCCVLFSLGKATEGVGKSKREKTENGQEGKPPAGERKLLGPEKMKERGFDNFLQSPYKKSRSVLEDARSHTLTISRIEYPVSEEFLRRYSETHLVFFCPLNSSTYQNKMLLCCWLSDRKSAHGMKKNEFPFWDKKKSIAHSKMSRFIAPTQCHGSPRQYTRRTRKGRCWCCLWADEQFKQMKCFSVSWPDLLRHLLHLPPSPAQHPWWSLKRKSGQF